MNDEKREQIRRLKQARQQLLNNYKTGVMQALPVVKSIDAIDADIKRLETEGGMTL